MGSYSHLEESFLEFFPGNYRWSAGLLLGLGASRFGGADVGEVHSIARRLTDAAEASDDDRWYEEWAAAGRRLAGEAESRAREGFVLTAAGMYLRGVNYVQIGERFVVPKTAESNAVYAESVTWFHRYAELTDDADIETVEVPYEGDTSLPAYLVRPRPGAARGAPYPCMVFFDGLDITKELQYLRGVAELSRRGIACLLVDGPGNGEALRFRSLPLRFDQEVAGTAAYEYAAAREEIDEQRVGVMGISLGGYFAPRSAAYEPRFAACVAWGAMWDYHRVWSDRVAASFAVPMSVAGDHIAWVLGVDTVEEALRKLEPWRLEGTARRITCPTLVVHGEDDRQVPLADARALVDEIAAEDKTLLVYGRDAPGSQHCQVDHPAVIDAIADWVSGRLGDR